MKSPKKLALSLLFMRGIAERHIFCKAAATKLWILHRADDVAISIDEVHCAGNADRSTLRIDEDFNVIAHRTSS